MRSSIWTISAGGCLPRRPPRRPPRRACTSSGRPPAPVDLPEVLVDTLLQLPHRLDADASQHLPGHLAEEALHHVEPRLIPIPGLELDEPHRVLLRQDEPPDAARHPRLHQEGAPRQDLRLVRGVQRGSLSCRWTWGIDDIDMEDERPESIGNQVVNAKACRSEDMGKPAPPRPRPKPGRAAIKNLGQARTPETQERTKEDPVIVYGFICRRLY